MAKLNDVGGSPIEDKTATYLENSSHQSFISNDTQRYLLQRHGTLELDPLPSISPEDPLNWPRWKKNTQLLMVAFHAMMNTFMAAGIIPAFYNFSTKYGTTIEESSYLTSVQVHYPPYFAIFSMFRVDPIPDIIPRHLPLHVESSSKAIWPSTCLPHIDSG
jgi:hypothetical protein